MEKKKSRGRTRRKPSSRIANFFYSEGRRWCAAALSLCLLLNSMVSTAWAAETENIGKTADAGETEEILFSLTRNALYEALQEAVRKGNIVDKVFAFQGEEEKVKAYETLFSFVDGTVLDEGLYELKPKFENEEEDRKAEDKEEKDKEKKEELQLRIFVSLDGEVDPEREYMLNGEEKVFFYLSNPSEKEQSAIIQIDEKKTEKITVIPRSDVIIDGEDEQESNNEESVSDNLSVGASGGSSGGISANGSGSAEKEGEQAVIETESGTGSEEDMKVSGESGSEEEQETGGEQGTEESRADREEGSEESRADGESGSEESRADGESGSEESRADGEQGSEESRADREQGSEESQANGEQEVKKEQETDKKQDDEGNQDLKGTQEIEEKQETNGTQEVKEKQEVSQKQEGGEKQDEGNNSASEEKKTETDKSENNQPEREKSGADKQEKDREETVKHENSASEKSSENTDSSNGDTRDSSDEGKELSAVISRNIVRLVAERLEEINGEEAENLEEASASDAEHGKNAEYEGNAEETASPSNAEEEEILGELYEAVAVEKESVVLFVTTTEELRLNDAALRIASDSNARRISPAFEKEIALENVIVQVKAEENVLPEEVTLQVTELKKEGEHAEQYEKAEEALKNQGKTYDTIMALDICFLDDEGNEVEPDGTVQVTFKQVKMETDEDADAGQESDKGEPAALSEEALSEEGEKKEQGENTAENIQVFHLDEETIKVKEMKTQTENNGDVVMETDHFSVYVLVAGDGVVSAGGYKVLFEHWIEVETKEGQKLYEKRYCSHKPVILTGNPGEKIENFVMDNGNYKPCGIEVEKVPAGGELKDTCQESTQDSTQKPTVSRPFPEESDNVYPYQDGVSKSNEEEIPIISDSIVRIYYQVDETTLEMPVTFYDYDIVECEAVGELGINSPENYDRKSTNATRIKSYQYHGGPKKNNLDINLDNSTLPRTGDLIIQGIVTGLNDYGNPIFGTDDNGEQLYDPGFFTNEKKTGKMIYPGNGEKKPRLQFKQKGDHYILKSAIFGGNETRAGENENLFFPLESVGNKITVGGMAKNYFFGLRHEFEFEIGDYIGPLEYSFAGDDDLWVFLDGRLVLDLGGIHGPYPIRAIEQATPGRIKWRNKVNLWYFLNHPNAECSDYGITPEESEANGDLAKWDKDAWKAGNYAGKHKVTILYMERGAWESTCAMEFTIPQPTSSVQPSQPVDGNATTVTVKKKWADDQSNSSIHPDIDVQLFWRNKGSADSWTPFMKSDGKYARETLNDQNQWSFQFANLPISYEPNGTHKEIEYMVFEMDGDNKVEQDGCIVLKEQQKDQQYTVSYATKDQPDKGVSRQIEITNQRSSDITINKTFINGAKVFNTKKQEFEKVEFALYNTDEQWTVPSENTNPIKTAKIKLNLPSDGEISSEENNITGVVEFTSVTQGYYILRELNPPAGYQIAEEKRIYVGERAESDLQQYGFGVYLYENNKYRYIGGKTESIPIENIPYGALLPDTGGPGLLMLERYGWFLLMLALLMSGVEVCCYGRRRVRKIAVEQREDYEELM